MNDSVLALETVRDYYGKTLKTNGDLKTNACCSYDSLPKSQGKILDLIDDEILDRFYGCGSPIPQDIKGQVILDLGCGTGRDVFMASYLVGEDGSVIGVDMTDEQLNVAERHIDSQMKRFGYSQRNVEFKKGYIEDLQSIGLKDNSIDVVISNCVINLSPYKEKVFREIFRVLKPGGELYFSDVFTGRRVPQDLKSDPVLYGECLGGALYIEDFRRMLATLGCPDYRTTKKTQIVLTNDDVERLAGSIDFYSVTIRAFKLDSLEDICEDYGQLAIYNGTIDEAPHYFTLDDHHIFYTGKPLLVCGNTASMLQETRYGKHFQIIGDRSVHHGPFSGCSSGTDNDRNETNAGNCC